MPIIVGETPTAIEISRRLLDRGVYVTGFGYPVVPEGTARVRIQVSAALSAAQIETAVAAVAEVAGEVAVSSQPALATATKISAHAHDLVDVDVLVGRVGRGEVAGAENERLRPGEIDEVVRVGPRRNADALAASTR